MRGVFRQREAGHEAGNRADCREIQDIADASIAETPMLLKHQCFKRNQQLQLLLRSTKLVCVHIHLNQYVHRGDTTMGNVCWTLCPSCALHTQNQLNRGTKAQESATREHRQDFVPRSIAPGLPFPAFAIGLLSSALFASL